MLQAGSNGATSVEVVEAVQFPTNCNGHSVGESPSSTAASSPMAGNDGNLHSLSPQQCQQQQQHPSQLQSATPPTPAEEASVTYQVRLGNGYRIRVVVFVVHEEPVGAVAAAGGATHFTWRAVARSECRKGCSGPVLRSIQRFGRLGRRSGAPPTGFGGSGCGSGGGSPVMPSSSAHYHDSAGASSPNGGVAAASCNSPAERDKVKEAKYLYLSIDEAGTHVGARAFRLVAAAYDAAGLVPLGATVSPPIRVLANNDVPTGAAFITLHLPLRADWQGWVPGRSGGGVAAAMRAAAAAAAGIIGSSPLGHNNSSSSSPASAAVAAVAAQRAAAVASPPRSPNKRPAAAAARQQQQAQARQQQHTQAFAASSLPHLLLSHAVSSSLLNDPSAAATGAAAAAPRPLPPHVSAAAAVPCDEGDFGGNAATGNGGSPPKRQRKQEGGGKETAAATGANLFSLSAGAGVPAPPASTLVAPTAKPLFEETDAATAAAAAAAPSPSAALAARLFHTGVGSPTAAAAASNIAAAGLPHLVASRLFSVAANNASASPSAPGSPGLPTLAPALLGSWGAQHHHHLLSAIGHSHGHGVHGGGGGSSSGGSGSPLALDALSGGTTPTAAWRTASLSALVAGWPATPRSTAIAQAAAAAGTGLQSAGGSGNPLSGGGGEQQQGQQQVKETAAAAAAVAAAQFNSAVAP